VTIVAVSAPTVPRNLATVARAHLGQERLNDPARACGDDADRRRLARVLHDLGLDVEKILRPPHLPFGQGLM
jgi:hypothetical protein